MCNGPGLYSVFSKFKLQKHLEDNLFICISSDKYVFVVGYVLNLQCYMPVTVYVLAATYLIYMLKLV
jgi:hypothetical protein